MLSIKGKYMDLNMIILIYILLTLSFKLKELRLFQIPISIFLIIQYLLSNDVRLTFSNIIFVILGIAVSPLLLNTSMYLSYGFTLSGVINNGISIYCLLLTGVFAFYEELIWRTIFFSGINLKIPGIILIIVINSFMFTISHSNINDIIDLMERLIFSIFLGIAHIYFPGLNYGIHIGRNIIIKYLE